MKMNVVFTKMYIFSETWNSNDCNDRKIEDDWMDLDDNGIATSKDTKSSIGCIWWNKKTTDCKFLSTFKHAHEITTHNFLSFPIFFGCVIKDPSALLTKKKSFKKSFYNYHTVQVQESSPIIFIETSL